MDNESDLIYFLVKKSKQLQLWMVEILELIEDLDKSKDNYWNLLREYTNQYYNLLNEFNDISNKLLSYSKGDFDIETKITTD